MKSYKKSQFIVTFISCFIAILLSDVIGDIIGFKYNALINSFDIFKLLLDIVIFASCYLPSYLLLSLIVKKSIK